MINNRLPVNIQLFAEASEQTQEQTANSNEEQSAPVIDYSKIQQMLDGTLAAKEDTALKAYFKQQGLSQEEMAQAIESFKTQKAAQQPDVGAIQQQLEVLKLEAQTVKLEKAATIAGVGLGLEAKTIPYIIKMADLSSAIGEHGVVDDDKVTAALNKVLEDIPSLKPQKRETTGFVQVGTDGEQTKNQNNDILAGIFGNKKG